MTLQKSCTNPASRLSWMWALLPLLLAATLVVPLLDVDAFHGDEPASLLAAGVLRSGPLSLKATWSYITSSDPDQAYGWPLLLAIWGRLVGWSEVAIRALSLFFGLLTLAWVYRTGRDLLAARAGFFAALLLSASVFFLAYMIHARAYTLVALCTALCIWSYWRIVLHPRLPGLGAQAGLLLGSAGLLYAHYFSALFLPALCLFHFLFVPKNRRWWQPILLLILAALLAMLQLPGILRGLDKTIVVATLHNRALTTPILVSYFIRNVTNGLLDPSPPLNGLLLVSLPLALAIVTLWRLRRGKGVNAIWLLVFTSAVMLALVIVINEVFGFIGRNGIRFLMPLWPVAALLTAATLWRLARRYRRPVAILLALWLVLGAWLTGATDYRYGLGYFFRLDPNHVREILYGHVATTDLLLVDYSVSKLIRGWFNSPNLGITQEYIYRYKLDPYEGVRPVHADYPYLWLLYLSKHQVVGFADLPHELGRVFCERALDEWGFTLERYALHSVENCPDRPVRLAFDSGIQLTAPGITISNGRLRLDAHFRSEDSYLLSRYSLAVHIIDQSGERVAQGDTGVGPGAIVPFRSEIDVSALPPGGYEVRVALYDWQTGGRLSARDPETDAESDMHTLHRFHLG